MISLLASGRSQRTNLLAGLFIVIALLLFGGWATVKMLQRPLYRSVIYYTFPPEVTGLRIGTPVMVAGYKVGLVIGIEHRWPEAQEPSQPSAPCKVKEEIPLTSHDHQLRFRLTLAVDQDWQAKIQENSFVSLENPNLLSGPVVMLQLRDGDPLCARSAIHFEPTESDLQKARKILARTETVLNELAEARIPQAADEVLERANRAVQSLAETAGKLNQAVGKLDEQDIDKIRAVIDETQRASRQLNTLLQKDAQALLHQANQATQSLTKTLAATRPALTSASQNLEYTLTLTANRLPGILVNLENAIQELSGLVADLHANPVGTLRGRGSKAPVWADERQ